MPNGGTDSGIFRIKNNLKMPMMGFGVFQVTDKNVANSQC